MSPRRSAEVGVEGLDFLEPDLAAGVPGAEGPDQPAERRAFGRHDEPDAQQPAGVTGQFAGLGQGPVERRQRRRDPGA